MSACHCLRVGAGQRSVFSRAPYQVALMSLFVMRSLALEPLLREAYRVFFIGCVAWTSVWD